jgi:hypothetical protein
MLKKEIIAKNKKPFKEKKNRTVVSNKENGYGKIIFVSLFDIFKCLKNEYAFTMMLFV